MADFSDEVKKYGSVSAAMTAKGYTKNEKGAWTKSSSSTSSGSSASSTSSNKSNTTSSSSNKSTTGTSSNKSTSSSSSKSSASTSSGSSGSSLNQYGYRDNFDYSAALSNNNLSASERAQLTQERQNKINQKYGGVEPNMTGSNQTYTQSQQKNNSSSGSNKNGTSSSVGSAYSGASSGASGSSGSSSLPSLNQYGYRDNFDYSAALSSGNLTAAERAQLTQERQNKISQQYGGVEPNLIGSNQTYSQAQASGAGNSGNVYNFMGVDYTQTGGGLYGTPTLNSAIKNQTQNGVTSAVGPNMGRRQDLAGGYAISNGYTVFYDEDGYAKKAIKGVVDYTPHLDVNAANGSYNTSGAWTDNEMLSETDKQKISAIRAQLQAGQITGDQANAAANAIRAGYGYSIDKNGYVTDNGALSAVNDRRTQLGLSTNAEGGSTAYYRYLMNTDTTPAAQAAGTVKSYDTFANENGYASPTISVGTNGSVPTATVTPLPGSSASDLDLGLTGSSGGGGSGNVGSGIVDTYTPGSMNNYLEQWYQDAQEQQKNTIDFGTSQSVNELIRAQQDAEAQYQAQRNQIAIDEAKAKDNQSLYAEARGDKGGIGAAQYDSIMNTAAQNRLSVNSAQTKLATDTSRQIADLRAQGEYEKADAMLQLSQQYLSQLMSLEQWGMEYNLSVAQFNASLQQWEAEYELKVADLLGSYNGTPTLSAQQLAFSQQQYEDELAASQDSKLANAGEILLAAGIMPSTSQLKAMGMSQDDAQNYITAMKVQQVAQTSSKSSKSTSSTSASGTSTGGSDSDAAGDADYDGLFRAAYDHGGGNYAKNYIAQHYKEYGLGSSTGLYDAYTEWAEDMDGFDDAFNDQIQALSSWLSASVGGGRSTTSEVKNSMYNKAIEKYNYLWSHGNTAQRQRLNKLMNAYGITE